jgi:hypothetical protein
MKEPLSRLKLVVIYVALWLGLGSLAVLTHLIWRPHYISVQACLNGGLANFFGPWARPMAAGWPNAGKPPHFPLVILGGVLLGIFAVLIGASMTGRESWFQMLCIGLFVPAMLLWILLGFVELVCCAS